MVTLRNPSIPAAPSSLTSVIITSGEEVSIPPVIVRPTYSYMNHMIVT